MNHFKQESQFHTSRRKPHDKEAKSILFHADSNDPDMLYFSRLQALDLDPAFTAGGRRFAVISAGEYGRMAKESAFDEILVLDDLREGAAERFKLPTE